MPGSVFVHNRLTHSLEVACVGRSLGDKIGRELYRKYNSDFLPFLEMGSIVSAACLAHDLGNPPFGHSGEKAIATFFTDGVGKDLLHKMEKEGSRISDLTNFEGNANSFRLLTHRFKGRREGGFVMTYTTLASIVKYPYASTLAGKKGKFGFFASEEEGYRKIAEDLGIIKTSEDPLAFVRHPLVYLVEAADDICYQIMDIEDAHKLKIITTKECKDLLMDYFPVDKKDHIHKVMSFVDDINEQVAYLRSSVIGKLIDAASATFIENEDLILKGKFQSSLIKNIEEYTFNAYNKCAILAFENIYKSQDVLDVELAGYRIIHFLLSCFIKAIDQPDKAYSKLMIERIPRQFETDAKDTYTKVQSIVDYISGMTDIYALDLYQKITGMNLPKL